MGSTIGASKLASNNKVERKTGITEHEELTHGKAKTADRALRVHAVVRILRHLEVGASIRQKSLLPTVKKKCPGPPYDIANPTDCKQSNQVPYKLDFTRTQQGTKVSVGGFLCTRKFEQKPINCGDSNNRTERKCAHYPRSHIKCFA